MRATNSGFSVSNIADMYANNTVAQRCQHRVLLRATSGAQACCWCLLPCLHHLCRWLPNTLQRTSAHLSCDHMLPSPSAHGQSTPLPELSLPEGCRLLCCTTAGGTANTDHPDGLALFSGLGGARTCLSCPLTKIASPWVTENKTKQNKLTEAFLPLMVHHKS